MSAATEITERTHLDTAADSTVPAESSPLLGKPGDALQRLGDHFYMNLFKGTAWLAQAGALLLLILVLTGVFSHPLLLLVSPHPILMSAGIVAVLQSILVLQPTFRPDDKTRGARVHAVLHIVSIVLLGAGTAVIETNKIRSHGEHFHSAHGTFGVITLSFLVVQYLFGLLMWWGPTQRLVFRSTDGAKQQWKKHRWAAYSFALPLLLLTAALATATDYNVNVLDIKAWAVAVAVILVVAGVYPRIHGRKLGLTA